MMELLLDGANSPASAMSIVDALYMMAWRIDWSARDDAVDQANLQAVNYAEIPQEK